jgi:hypothetical protein
LPKMRVWHRLRPFVEGRRRLRASLTGEHIIQAPVRKGLRPAPSILIKLS